MDFELTIEGFSQDNIRKCCTQYLYSPEKSERLLQQAMRVGIDNLLKVPIILLMVCVLFSEGEALPKARTKIVSKIFELTINRTTLKSLSPEEYTEFKKSFNDLMHALGELSWKALRQNVPRLAVNKVGLLFPKSFVKLKDKNEKAYKDPNQRFLGHLNLMYLCMLQIIQPPKKDKTDLNNIMTLNSSSLKKAILQATFSLVLCSVNHKILR